MPKYIELTQSKIAIVNNYDYRWCCLRKWHYRNGKAYTTIDGKEVSMGRYVMRVFDPEVKVEYIDGDGLNCRKSNLKTNKNETRTTQNDSNRKED